MPKCMYESVGAKILVHIDVEVRMPVRDCISKLSKHQKILAARCPIFLYVLVKMCVCQESLEHLIA